jgi:hypothetical protein
LQNSVEHHRSAIQAIGRLIGIAELSAQMLEMPIFA